MFMAFLLVSSWLPARIEESRNSETMKKNPNNELKHKNQEENTLTFWAFRFLQVLLTSHFGFLSITTTHFSVSVVVWCQTIRRLIWKPKIDSSFALGSKRAEEQ